MPFKGFNVAYPEYEVITPQTKQSFHVRSLNVQEEERLKGSLVTPSKITDHLNKCIFDSIVRKPDKIKTYEDFLKSVTIRDRDALLYGLYHITYDEIRNYEVACAECRRTYPVTVEASATFNMQTYPGNDVLTKTIKIDLPVTKGVSAFIKQPTLHDENRAVSQLSARPGSNLDLITETLIVERFEQDVPEDKQPIVYKDSVDIIDAYLSLPARDKRSMYNAYMEHFGKYAVELKMQSHCPTCTFSEVIDIDLVENFFRMVFSV